MASRVTTAVKAAAASIPKAQKAVPARAVELRKESLKSFEEARDWNKPRLDWPSPTCYWIFSRQVRWCSFFMCEFFPRDGIPKKAEALMLEAKENGNFKELMNLPVTDPKHPYYHEWGHTFLEKNPHLWNKTALGKWRKLQMDLARYNREFDVLGLFTDDCLFWKSKMFTEGLQRLNTVELNERERRLHRAQDFLSNFSVLPEEHWVHPDEDASYLFPHMKMSEDEATESGYFGGDFR